MPTRKISSIEHISEIGIQQKVMDSLTLKNWIIHFTNQNSKFDDIPIDVPEYIILGSYKLNFEWFRLLQ